MLNLSEIEVIDDGSLASPSAFASRFPVAVVDEVTVGGGVVSATSRLLELSCATEAGTTVTVSAPQVEFAEVSSVSPVKLAVQL